MRKEDKMSTAVGVEGEDRGLARVAIATQRRPGLRSSWPDDSRSHARRSREVGGFPYPLGFDPQAVAHLIPRLQS